MAVHILIGSKRCGVRLLTFVRVSGDKVVLSKSVAAGWRGEPFVQVTAIDFRVLDFSLSL